ncbi:unnamed protein product [Urochloa decumbens]|uniref:Uncharacterized protein n=1 Tax=Urochloa decumbens TaxID=240449 RepID=A0ABC9DQL3_9POAL
MADREMSLLVEDLTALVRDMERAAIRSLTEPLIESVRLPGARSPARLATWSKDTPELKLNLSLLVEAFLQLLASGLGTLALVWATVVLLGGFSSMLVRMDFWFITAIVFVETARIVGYNSAPEAKFFVDVAQTFSEEDMRVGRSTNFVRLLTMGPTWLALAPIFLATTCISLSIIRLAGIARHDYGVSSSNIDASNGNLKPALILFYSLVLTQGALFLLWFGVAMNRSGLAADLSRKYMKRHLELDSRKQLIDRYVNSIADTCIAKGVSSTVNSNLVSFAAELLLQSDHLNDHISAVLVLHSLVIINKERSEGAVEQICSSGKVVCGLVRMLRSKNLEPHHKACIAEIVAKLACKLRLQDIPGVAHCISSLLDSHFMNKAKRIIFRNDYNIISLSSSAEIKPLFVHGLLILGELATDPENCTEMCNTVDLVPKIIAPVKNGLHMAMTNDPITVEIVRESLRVVAKLTSGTCESSRKLCHELPEHGRTADNILWILSNSTDEDMRMLAVEILSRLILDKPRMLQFSVQLQRLLFDPQDSPLRIAAGKALSALVTSYRDEFPDEFPDIQQLVTIMNTDAYSKEYRAVTAEILAQICAKSRTDKDRNCLSSVTNALSMVLTAIVDTDITEDDIRSNSKEVFCVMKFFASFLGFAVQIREKLVTAEAFATAVTGLPRGNNIFAEKLKEIIKITNDREFLKIDSEDEVRLVIMKATSKLLTWMMEIDTITSQGYIQYFRQVNIAQKLDAAVVAMAHLERYVVMTGGAEMEMERYVTLQTLVETAKRNLVSPQQH